MARNKDFFVNSTPKRDRSFFVKEEKTTSNVVKANTYPIKDKYNSAFAMPVKQGIGDKVANFFKMTLPTAAEKAVDNIKEPFTGASVSKLMTEAKLSPQMMVDDAKIQLAKENPTREDYAMVKQTQEVIDKYGKPESNFRAISEDTTKLQEQLKSAEKTWQVSPVDATLANTGAGVANIFGSLGSFANSLGADKVPLLKDVTNFAVDGARKAQENAQQYNRGNYGEALGTVTQGVVNLVPYFVLGTGKTAVKGATAVTKYAKYIEPIIKNPSFWYSLTSMWGSKYQEKLDEGYNRFQALGNSILYAVPAALIEVSGGIGAKGKETQSLLRTMGEEIGEEIAQDIMGGISDKVATNHDLPIFSTTEDAIINPKQLAKTAAYTAPIVAIGGGANNVINKSINNRVENQKVQAQINQDLQNYRKKFNQNTDLSIQPENVAGLPKLNVQNGLQTANNQQTNVTLPTQAEMAQKANTEQINTSPNLATQKAQKTYQSAKIAGMTDVDMKKAIDLNNMLRSGANLEFYDPKNIPQGVDTLRAADANGFYMNGTLWINKNSEMKVEKILGHELTHYVENDDLVNTILDSNIFYDFLAEKGFNNTAEFKTYLMEKKGYKQNELNSEMVAHFAEEKLFGKEETINRLARENRTLAQKILNWISDLRTKIAGSTEAKELLRIENMYRKALDQARNVDTSLTDAQYSIAGVKGARRLRKNLAYRNIMENYKSAKKFFKEGYDNARLIEETGWYRDNEGNWKYEFSDEDMTLKENIKLDNKKIYPLDKMLKHDVLFEAYPQLRNYTVILADIGSEHRAGIFSPAKIILLNPNYANTKESAEYELAHEIQHAIQVIEGFPGAATNKNGKYAYYTSLGEIEARDVSERLRMLQNQRKQYIPETAKENPTHEGLERYLNRRTEGERLKDEEYIQRQEARDNLKKSIKNFFGGGVGYAQDIDMDNSQNNTEAQSKANRVLHNENIENKRLAGKEPAFSMPETDNLVIKNEVTNSYDDEVYNQMTAELDGEIIGKIEYSVYNDVPHIQMIETKPEYRRKGVATKLLQELQKEYEGKEIDFGMTTPDGTKLLESITYSVENKKVAKKLNRIKKIDKIINEYDKQLGYYEENGLRVPEGYADDYNKLIDEKRMLEDETYDKEVNERFVRYSVNPVEVAKNPKAQEPNLLNEIAPIDEKQLENVEEKETTASILTKSPKRPAKDLLKQSVDVVMRKLVDAGNTINTVGKLTGDKHLYEYFNNTKQARQSAEYMIGEAQTDIKGNRVGNSLIRIFEEVRSKGDAYTNEFFEYLLHMHNIDRMAQNKPVFGGSVKAEDSQRIANELLEKHPEFEKQANKVYAYNRNLMQWRVDSGLISKEQADLMNEMYPHYVPTFRDVSGTSGSKAMQGTVQITNTVRKAKGSNKDIMPIDASMARQTMQTVQAAKRNLLGNRLLNDALNNKDKVGEYIQAVEKTTDKADLETELDTPKDTNLDSNNNVFKIFRNGETFVMQVNNGIYEGLKSISSEIDNTDTALLLKPVKAANNMFKKLITGYSPMFTIKNFARDIQDSGLYSKELREFIKKYPNTYKEMISNGKMWQLYKSLGGTGSSFFDYETGIEKTLDTKNKTSTKIKEATIGKVEELNMMIEQAPRFAEFMATIDKAGNQNYDTLMEAMLNAADITVNFGRSGTWGKALNATAVPFFNPSIQGFDKFARTVLESRDGKKFAKLAIRATLLGILPSVINELLYWDDEEYENLTDRDKDTNFLIKTGDNKWLKIPKGRVLSIFGNTAVRGLRTLKGEEWDVGEFFKNQASQTAPISVLESNIASPIQAVKNNKTWYGSDIVPQRLQDYAPKDQYDENTDVFSKWLGSKINYSPKKINYLIDAYTGIIGDVVLPLTTPKAETNPFTKAFVVDGVTSNEISNDFYNMLDKYNPKQNPKKSAKEVSRYLNKQSSQVSDIYKQIREVENSDISDEEKRKQVRELRELANTIELTAMATAPEYEKAVEKYRGTFADEDVDSDYAYLFANRDIFGAEYAVKTFSKSLYNNHKNENMDKFFRSYFTKQYFQKKLEPEKTKTTNTLPTLKQQRAKLPTLKK